MALQHPLDAKHDRGVESTLLSKNELRALALYFSDAVIGAGYSPYEGKVNPMLAASALARGAERAGASFHRHTELRALARGGAAFKAATNRGTIGCQRVVIVAGARSGEIAAMIGHELPMSCRVLHMNVAEPAEPVVPHPVLHMGRRLTPKQTSNGAIIVRRRLAGQGGSRLDQPAGVCFRPASGATSWWRRAWCRRWPGCA